MIYYFWKRSVHLDYFLALCGRYRIIFDQKVAYHFEDKLPQTPFFHVAHVTSITKCEPTYMGYVFEERSSAYVPRSVMLAIEYQGNCFDVRKPWNDGPSYQGADGR